MRPIATRDYGHCPKCGAPNLRHRCDCYICHAPLGTGVQHQPYPSGPADTEQSRDGAVIDNRRRYARDEIRTHRLTIEGEGIPRHEAYFRNVGPTSIGIATTIACERGAHVSVEITIEGSTYRCDGVVRHSTRDIDGLRTVFLVGIQFSHAVPPLSLLFAPGRRAA